MCMIVCPDAGLFWGWRRKRRKRKRSRRRRGPRRGPSGRRAALGIIHHIPSRWRLPRGWRCRCPRAPSGWTRWWWGWPPWTATRPSRAWGSRARPASACRWVQWPGAGACRRQRAAPALTQRPAARLLQATSRSPRRREQGLPPSLSGLPDSAPFALAPDSALSAHSLLQAPGRFFGTAEPPLLEVLTHLLSPRLPGASRGFPDRGRPRKKIDPEADRLEGLGQLG